jgi:PKD repeat protein
MKKSYNVLSAFVFAVSSVFAQQQQIIPCHTDEVMNKYFAEHPEAKARYETEQKTQFSSEYLNQLARNNKNGNNSVDGNTTVYALDTIPVVFHILHQGGPENVSNAVIVAALAEVNRVHTKTTPDTASIDPYFKSVYGANNYVFKLATIDPNGNCTNGITREYDANTNWNETTSPHSYTWNPQKYLNVYIVKSIGPVTAGSTIVGYTYIPGTFAAGNSYDAVIYNASFLTGTNARSLAHEFGHWIGLSHTFGNTNNPGKACGDDNLAGGTGGQGTGVIDDTPITLGDFSTCPALDTNFCDPSNHANIQNIMNYSSCPLNFTNGQIHRIHNVMALSTSGRNNVTTAANKIATGVRNPKVCVPIPYFHASSTVVCAGSTVTFSDSSSNAQVTGWNWNFPGGTLANGSSLTDSMPKVIYSNVGPYAVSYTASTSAGSAPITKTSYINVQSSTATYNTAYTEGFEISTVPGTDWSISNSNPSGTDWMVTSNAAATGSNCVMIDNINNTAGDTSALTSPTFNLASIGGAGSAILGFALSYQQQVTTNTDKLQVYVSTDCGSTWVSKWARSGTTLQPVTVTGQSTSPFVPMPSQFTTYTVSLGSSVASSTNAIFRWIFYAGATSPGNNIYIDNINLYSTATAIADIETEIGLSLYPNPSSGNVNISFKLADKHTIAVNIEDMLGRSIETIPSKQYASGETIIAIGSKASYQTGVYFVNINVDGQHISRKVIIQ